MLTDTVLKNAQQLRMKRFGISVATYIVAIIATALITFLGIGKLTLEQWASLMSICLFGISLFFILFYTNTNLWFSEPSLTREQIVYASFYGFTAMYWLPEARPIILMFFLPPFTFGVLILTLKQYFHVVIVVMGLYTAFLGFEFLQNPHGFNIQYQLYLLVLFGILLIWFAFFGGFVSNIKRRLRLQKKELKKAHEEIIVEMEERKQAQIEKDNLIIELKNALEKVKTLNGLLPICSSCKNIRDDKGYWNNLESYIETHSEAAFSHSLCPDCSDKFYGNESWYIKMKQKKERA